MKILGIDCSTNSLAFSVFEDGRLTHWGEVSFGKGDHLHRMNNANRVVSSMLDQNQFRGIDKVVFEGAVMIQNRQTVINLAMAYGAAVAPFIRPGVIAETIPPMTWQNKIGNKAWTKAEKAEVERKFPGKSKSWYSAKLREMRKQRTVDWVIKEFGIVPANDNVADAIAIGAVAAGRG